LSNHQEFLFGTSPTASDGPLVTATPGTGTLFLRWLQRETGSTYTVRQSATLAVGSWTTVASLSPAIDVNQSGAPSEYDYHSVTLPTPEGKLFFRIEARED